MLLYDHVANWEVICCGKNTLTSARASQMFDYIVKRDGPPKTERDLQFLFLYCGHKYASIVRDPDGNIVEEPEKYPTEE